MSNDPLEVLKQEYEESHNLVADLSALKAYEPRFDMNMKALMERVRPQTEA